MNKQLDEKLNFMIRFIVVVIVFCYLSASQSVFAQSTAEGLLKNIQDKFDSINDLSAEVTQSINGKVNLNGKVYYKKEDHLRFEFKNVLIVSDGKTSWNYNKKQNKVVISDYDAEGNKIFSIQQMIYEYPKECELSTYESEGEEALQLIPKNNSLSFNSVKLFISDDYLISKVLIDDPVSGSIQVDLSNYQLNKKIPDSYFTFSPPEGSQVLDLR